VRTHPILDPLTMAGVKMGLERMRGFLATIGNPHLRYPVIHVAGTNGKGSVCRMVGAMLAAQGYKVGITTSPHLQHINERIRVYSGEGPATPISDADLDDVIRRIRDARDLWAQEALGPNEPMPLTWFEFSIAAAFQHFADAQVDVAVVETGMGGRLDATNVVHPLLTAVVTIGLDHTDHLGPDHASIAAEKAGIIKRGVPVVIGPLPKAALSVVRAQARDMQAPSYEWGEQFAGWGSSDGAAHADSSSTEVHVRTTLVDQTTTERSGLALGLPGDHQIVNAAVACQLIDLLPDRLRVSDNAVRIGLAAAKNRGRLEWLAPDLLVDGAHNPDGASTLARYLASLPRDRRRTLVLGGGSDKDIRAVAVALAPQVDRILTTVGTHPKARSPWEVARELEGLMVPVVPSGGLPEALASARNGEDLVIVAGSLYLIGDVREHLGVS